MRWTLLISSVFFLPGCFDGILIKPVQCSGPIEESVVYNAHRRLCRNKIAIIDVDGVLLNAETPGLLTKGENPVSEFREKLDAAAADRHVKAVVLRINSPGGGVTASDIMFQDLINFRYYTGKPVVACMMDVAASGGYYLAMGADLVYAHPTTITGSIGVIMNLYNASGLFESIGITSNPIKSGKNKDLGNPARPMSEEERALLQRIVDSYHANFVEKVAWGRQMSEGEVRALADGRVYTGEEARRLGLVDETGYLEDAIQAALDLACIKDAKIVVYDRCKGYRGSCYAMPSIPSEINVKVTVPGILPRQACFMYLWQPGAGL
ncbi:MAG: signal peptide peptidase SppA [Gemmatales bacterium]|nr:MAG: signal peptide peptidase SppA [Gemmatales bacterium]